MEELIKLYLENYEAITKDFTTTKYDKNKSIIDFILSTLESSLIDEEEFKELSTINHEEKMLNKIDNHITTINKEFDNKFTEQIEKMEEIKELFENKRNRFLQGKIKEYQGSIKHFKNLLR